MGDSETECSQVSDECDSPILYSNKFRDLVSTQGENTTKSVAESVPQRISRKISEAASSVSSLPDRDAQPPCSETQEISYSQSQYFGTLDVLSGLDSLLDVPPLKTSKISSELISGTKLQTAAKVSSRSTLAQIELTQVRSLDKILRRLPKQNVNKVSLMSQLDAQDMKMLVQACGEVVTSKTNKTTLCEKLIYLIQSGVLYKVLRCVATTDTASNATQKITPPVQTSHPNPTAAVTQAFLGGSAAPQTKSCNNSDIKAVEVPTRHEQTQCNVATGEGAAVINTTSNQWVPVTDGMTTRCNCLTYCSVLTVFYEPVSGITVSLLSVLNNDNTVMPDARSVHNAIPSMHSHSDGVFTAEQPHTAWKKCDLGKHVFYILYCTCID